LSLPGIRSSSSSSLNVRDGPAIGEGTEGDGVSDFLSKKPLGNSDARAIVRDKHQIQYEEVRLEQRVSENLELVIC
jgi:hypothetical protein